MKQFILLFTCTMMSVAGLSQDSLRTESPEKIVPRHAFKFSPFHFFSFYPTAQVSYEFRVAHSVSLHLDGGVVVDGAADHDNFREMRGFKAKVEPRYYFSFIQRRGIGWYVAAEMYYNKVDFDRTSEETECFEPGCANRYTRRYHYTVNHREQGLAFKIGMLKNFYPFLFDMSTGFAFRNIDYDAPSYINLEDQNDDWIDIPRMEDRVAFAPVFNFRIGYRFR